MKKHEEGKDSALGLEIYNSLSYSTGPRASRTILHEPIGVMSKEAYCLICKIPSIKSTDKVKHFELKKVHIGKADIMYLYILGELARLVFDKKHTFNDAVAYNELICCFEAHSLICQKLITEPTWEPP